MSNIKWNRQIPVSERSFTGLINSKLSHLDDVYEDCLPDIRNAKTILVGSDYSGEASTSPYTVFSFILTTMDSWKYWEPQRQKIRDEFFTDSRRMSFKRLNDGQRRRALNPLLEAANNLDGLSFTVALNKKCPSVFASRTPLDLSNPDFSPFRSWKQAVLEKAFFIIYTY